MVRCDYVLKEPLKGTRQAEVNWCTLTNFRQTPRQSNLECSAEYASIKDLIKERIKQMRIPSSIRWRSGAGLTLWVLASIIPQDSSHPSNNASAADVELMAEWATSVELAIVCTAFQVGKVTVPAFGHISRLVRSVWAKHAASDYACSFIEGDTQAMGQPHRSVVAASLH